MRVFSSGFYALSFVSVAGQEMISIYSCASGNGISVLGDTQKPPGHCPGQAALGESSKMHSLTPMSVCFTRNNETFNFMQMLILLAATF